MFRKILQRSLLYSTANTNSVVKRFAGHSKWANIKHTKALKDAQKGKMFTRLGHQIRVAIQEGGSPNPAHNLRLEQVIAQARRMNMPAGSVESIIKNTQKDKLQLKSHIFEIRGPGGCMILCEVSTPNLVKTRNDISNLMKKFPCKYVDGGGTKHLFEKKGVIETGLPPTEKGNSPESVLELATNHAIESEAEDVKLMEESNTLQFFCDPHSFGNVQTNLEKLNYKITSATLEYIPSLTVPLGDGDLETCSNFFDKLESMDDVIKLHDNIA